jgi:hypothetical protein
MQVIGIAYIVAPKNCHGCKVHCVPCFSFVLVALQSPLAPTLHSRIPSPPITERRRPNSALLTCVSTAPVVAGYIGGGMRKMGDRRLVVRCMGRRLRRRTVSTLARG